MFKRSLWILGLCFVLTSFIVHAGMAQETKQTKQEMMEAYMKMMAVNENHAFFKNFEGDWDVRTTAWMQPGAEPTVTQNGAKAELIFGGRFLKVNFKGSMFGQAFEGLQIIGYDNFYKKYMSFWIDSSSTSFYLTKGTRDEAKNVITEIGLWPDPMTGEKMKVRTVTKLISRNEYVFEMYMILPDGKEFKSMENRSTRKKSN
jgi:hypothetical protein